MKQNRIFLIGLMLALAGITQAANILKVQGVEVAPGESVTLSIELDNETTNLMGWQCDIVLPEGLSLALKANGKPAAMLGYRFSTTEHSISSSRLANGAYRFIATSIDGEAIPENTGTLFTVTLQADATVIPGTTLTGTVKNIEFNTQDNQKLSLADVSFTVTIPGGGNQKCSTPTISYNKGELTFSSATEGVEYVYQITDADIKEGTGNEVQLDITYNISVYAQKEGYDNSDVATATLTWIEVEPRTGELTTGVNEVQALPVLIQAVNGVITVKGADDGMKVEVYGTNGMLAGSAHSYNGTATVNTTLQPGTIAIVKIGGKTVKVMIK